METTETIQTLETQTTQAFTDEEQQLAERYQVEPKLCRLISEIVSEQAEPTKRPEPEEKQPGPGTTVENMVEEWLRKQNYKTKLAVVIFAEYMCGDHGTDKLIQRIEDEYQAEILRMAVCPDESLSTEEIFLTGVCAELFVWDKNL